MTILVSDGQLASLIARVAAADVAGFETLYRLTSAKLFGVVLRIVRDRGTAEDILQDAYVRVWQAASQFQSESGRPMTWMISIARHRAIDTMRRKAEVQVDAETASRLLEAGGLARDLQDDVAERSALDRCLGTLGLQQQEAILLAYVEGYSREELAGHLGRPVNTIKTWLNRGLATLRTCLEAP